MRGSKYTPLRDYLTQRGESEIVLTLEEIEDILGFELADRAGTPNWWANSTSLLGRAQRRAWADAGYDAFYLAKQGAVRFLTKARLQADPMRPPEAGRTGRNVSS